MRLRDVAPPSRLHGHQQILRLGHARHQQVPISLRHLAISIHVHAAGEVALALAEFIERHLPVLILIVLLQEIFPRRPWSIAFSRRPAGEKQQSLTRHRSRASKPCQPLNVPVLLAIPQIVALEPERARRNHLIQSVVPPDHRVPKLPLASGRAVSQSVFPVRTSSASSAES